MLEPEEHGLTTSKKYLVLLLLKGQKLLNDQNEGDSSSTSHSPSHARADRPTAQRYLIQFAELRQNFQGEKRMQFAVADVGSSGHGWQRLYVSAVKKIKCPCPVLVWHPKRNKFQLLDCSFADRSDRVLEQTLDGNVAGWILESWPE